MEFVFFLISKAKTSDDIRLNKECLSRKAYIKMNTFKCTSTGHVTRIKYNWTNKRIFNKRQEEKRGTGRPKLIWDNVDQNFRHLGKMKVESLALKKEEWEKPL
jgi:hypothetical protein